MKTKLVPFDIEKAKKGAKIVTRSGLSAKIVDVDVNNGHPVLCLVTWKDGIETPILYSIDGRYYPDQTDDRDIFIEEKEEEKPRREYSGTDSIYVPKDDEGIREELIDAINGLWDNDALPMPLSIKRKDAWLAWLHKQQGEKTADSFVISPYKWYTCIKEWHSIDMKIGDMFDEGHYYLGSDILKYKGLLEDDEDFKDYFHPWNISDAKDGDVLFSGEVIFIFNKIKGEWIHCCCTCHKDGSFVRDYDLMTAKYFNEVYPATIEQRDFLFQKIKEAGYEWDSDKKELHKIGKEVKTRRMTNQELAWWLRDCPEEHRELRYAGDKDVYNTYDYPENEANTLIKSILIRRNGGEWEEPLIEE